jgi:hypothetical protein
VSLHGDQRSASLTYMVGQQFGTNNTSRFRQQNHALNFVLEFAYISGPCIGEQKSLGFIAQTSRLSISFECELFHKIFRQRKNVFFTFAKGRDGNGKNIDSKIQILSEAIGCNLRFKIPIC